MSDFSHVFNAHPSFIDAMYQQYQDDPSSVQSDWRLFFEGFDFASLSANGNGSTSAPIKDGKISNTIDSREFRIFSLIKAYRNRGHLEAKTNPIRERRDRQAHLGLSDFDLSEADYDDTFVVGKEIGLENATLREIEAKLKQIYTTSVGYEYHNIQDREERRWLRTRIEKRSYHDLGLSMNKKKRILEKLNGAVVFEEFLGKKYVGQKRFSLEGGETTIAALDAIINKGAEEGVQEVVIGMAHRGRLNVLANIMGKTYEHIFSEFEGTAPQEQSFGDGDVKYHMGYSSQVVTPSGKKVDLKLAPNPSHLESVDPVVQGFARAKADMLFNSDYDKILPLLIHGDAAVAGQGVVYETVQMSKLKGYKVGGTIHFVINNQIGFTTDFDDARSSTYSTAAAAVVQAPVFHVNGDDAEAVIFVAELAMEYRQKFNADVFIDMVCYRKHGHNEADDPEFTQPEMYKFIKSHSNPRELYAAKLSEKGELEKELAENMRKEFNDLLQARLELAKEKELPYAYQKSENAWRELKKGVQDPAEFFPSPVTGIKKEMLDKLINHLMTIPEGFTPNRKILRLLKGKQKLLDQGKLDWAMAELLAYGSILLEGKDIRMSGQDVKRGTFSHRHAVLNDAKTYEEYNRLSNMSEDQGEYRIFNSLLSEFAVLGFEYGYSIAAPHNLVVWEAQFGDFYNGAQTIVDQYISAAESKWGRMSGLVMLLPHGYEGQGPEHSSTRMERFLQMCAEFNMTVANVSTPANFFHIIRRQLARPYRKPLIITSPKKLLRYDKCVSDLIAFDEAENFYEVYDDTTITTKAKAKKVKRVLFCTGKIYYDLLERKEADKRNDVAIVRVEQLYPFPKDQMNALVNDKYKSAEKFWVQEEPSNMGAWQYILAFYRNYNIELIGRKSSASPATGYKKQHDAEQLSIVDRSFA
jgi:2-oxoglutarate dehydrogenase E1 component